MCVPRNLVQEEVTENKRDCDGDIEQVTWPPSCRNHPHDRKHSEKQRWGTIARVLVPPQVLPSKSLETQGLCCNTQNCEVATTSDQLILHYNTGQNIITYVSKLHSF